MNVDEFIERVMEKANNQPDCDAGVMDPIKEACWFVACQEAHEVNDAYEIRDFAELIRDGMPLAGPFEDKKDLAAWIKDVEEGNDDEAWDWLEGALNRHYRIKEEE